MSELVSGNGPPPTENRLRFWIARGFGFVEDVTYVILGLLLGCIALALLAISTGHLVHSMLDGSLGTRITRILDQFLLTLLIIELLYTVQVSFRTHAIVPEPFLLVGLIAAIRRVLLLTAEYGELHEKTELALKCFIGELAVLTFPILVLVISIIILRKAGPEVRGEHA